MLAIKVRYNGGKNTRQSQEIFKALLLSTRLSLSEGTGKMNVCLLFLNTRSECFIALYLTQSPILAMIDFHFCCRRCMTQNKLVPFSILLKSV